MNPRHIRIGKEGYDALAKQDMTVARSILEKALADIRDPNRGWMRGGWGQADGPGCLNTRLTAAMSSFAKVPISGPFGANLFFEAHPQLQLLFDAALSSIKHGRVVVGLEWEDAPVEHTTVTRIIRWNDDLGRTAQDIELLLQNLIRVCRKVERNQVAARIAQFSAVDAAEAAIPQHVYVQQLG